MAEPVIRADAVSNNLCRLSEVLFFLICKGPGRTEAQLAEAVFGKRGLQSRVHFDCRLLEMSGRVERRGFGGAADPFTYHPVWAGSENGPVKKGRLMSPAFLMS